MLLVVAAFLAFQCSQLAGLVSRRDQWVFLVFCSLLLLMSCDEIARIHEVAPVVLFEYFGVVLEPDSLFYRHQWVVFAGPLVVAVFAGFFVILARVLKRHKPSLVLLGLGFAAIILGGVFLEGLSVLIPHGDMKRLEILVEETLEMTGTLLVCASLIGWRDHVASDTATR